MKAKIITLLLLSSILLPPAYSFAWDDACSVIAEMVSRGCNATFSNYEGKILEGYGFFGEQDGKNVAVHCPKDSGPDLGPGVVIVVTGRGFLNTKRGDRVHFRGTANRWKFREFVDTKKRYIVIELEDGIVW